MVLHARLVEAVLQLEVGLSPVMPLAILSQTYIDGPVLDWAPQLDITLA